MVKSFVACLSVFAALALPGQVLAEEFSGTGEPLQLAEAKRRPSLSDAIELVKKQTGGRVLAAQSERVEGRELYRIKVLTPDGEVRVVYVDATTGAIQ
jgi:uncharacterized membrane protein YkoI